MKTIEIEMKYEKSTKNTHVYKQDSDTPAIPSLYIRRDALPDKSETITVTIS